MRYFNLGILQSITARILKPYSAFSTAIKNVFSNWRYVTFTAVIASAFWVIFMTQDQLLFFSPILVFYVPDDAVPTFILSPIISIFIGMVSSMNLYALKYASVLLRGNRISGRRDAAPTFISGSLLGVISSVCASCTPSIMIFVSAIAGSSSGVMLSSFLTTYQLPLRILSLVILAWGLWSICHKIAYNNRCSHISCSP